MRRVLCIALLLTACRGSVGDGEVPCRDDADCMTGWFCRAETDGDGRCHEAKRACEQDSRFHAACTAGLGECLGTGRNVCHEDGTRLLCDALVGTPAAEVCDGRDNDCDGLTDNADEDGAPLTRGCYDGPFDTRGRAPCRDGVQTCAGGAWSGCDGQRTPDDEDCNGTDDDCDGRTDNVSGAAEPLQQPCYGGPANTADVGACRTGARTCRDAAWDDCSGEVRPDVEACDGADNDCDGVTDWPDVDLVLAPCELGAGTCAGDLHAASQCEGSGWAACTGAEYGAGFEVIESACDGLDNDCDDFTDAADADLVLAACEKSAGVCAAKTHAAAQCTATGWSACTAAEYGSAYEPGETRCDGLDNDCDGATDGADPALPLPACEKTLGACAGRVHLASQCTAAGWLACTPAEYGVDFEAAESRCDGHDNDCDGRTDALDPDLVLAGCEKTLGACAGRLHAAAQCTESGWAACGPDEYGTDYEDAESRCDGLDNDCNGQTDGADPTLVRAACEKTAGVCAGRLHSPTRCGAGGWSACTGDEYGTDYEELETRCDGRDNDCDGGTDALDADLVRAACEKTLGACAGKVHAAAQCGEAGWTLCTSAEYGTDFEAFESRCDAKDNDCDGQSDADDTDLVMAGCEKAAGVCAGKTHVRGQCGASGWAACTTAEYGTDYESTDTACDGLDADCDGVTDAGTCGAHASCISLPDGIGCACDVGWQGDGDSCSDIDECASANGGCDANATCANTPGGRTCACNTGWSGDGDSCTDIDECGVNHGGCDPNATCRNTPGSRTCTCRPGWTGDGVACTWDGPYCVDGMCLVPAGSFMMGCNAAIDADCQDDESPYHRVTLSEYSIDETEVTQAAYKGCMDAGICVAPGTEGSCAWNPATRDGHAAVCIDWHQAKAFCAWAGKRLPTEAEWEMAARGADGRVYPWGNQSPSCSRAVWSEGGNGCGAGDYWAVGRKPDGASPYGLQDAAGNAYEWVSDWHGAYSSDAATDPTGPSNGVHRIHRGGCWYTTAPEFMRISHRYRGDPLLVSSGVGFRCARSASRCTANNGGCDPNAICMNSATDAGTTCSCKPGYQGDGLACTDIDECATDHGGCDANATCTNTPGGHTCTCRPGWSGDGLTCMWAGPFCVDGMCLVPAGTFIMGCNAQIDSQCALDEYPAHAVSLAEYYVDETETPQGAYRTCVTAGGCSEPAAGSYCNWSAADREQTPVNCIDWTQARNYCAWSMKSLPTEAQWEMAARGTDARKYPWGNAPATCDVAVMTGDQPGCGANAMWRVGSKPGGASPFGLLDMAGNASEWVADWNGSYSTAPASDPAGPPIGSERIMRGGSFGDHATWLRASSRSTSSPALAYSHFGFRCARTASRCTANNGGCDANAYCMNAPGPTGVACTCKPGWQSNGAACRPASVPSGGTWAYRRTVLVAGSTAGTLTGYPVPVQVDTAALVGGGKMLSTGADIRFMSDTGGELPWWIESGLNTATTRIWVRVDTIPSSGKSIRLYYGNPTARTHGTVANNGKATFAVFDDFEGPAVDSEVWAPSGYSMATQSGGTLRLSAANGAYVSVRTRPTLAGSLIASFDYQMSTSPNPSWKSAMFGARVGHAEDLVADPAAATSCGWWSNGTTCEALNGSHAGHLALNAAEQSFALHQGAFGCATPFRKPLPSAYYLDFYVITGDGSSMTVDLRNMRIRPFVSPEPVAGAPGAEESL